MDTETAVVLCADDYGLSEGVSRGIIDLLERGRISATSAMTNTPAWLGMAAELRPYVGRVGIGLHLNLTAGAPLGAMPTLAPGGTLPGLRSLTTRALGRALPVREIEAEVARQLDRFEDALGRPPDFVDGHQHVHALPGLRGSLLRALVARRPARGFWVRDPADRIGALIQRRLAAGKALAVTALSLGFGAAARRAGLDTNEGFSGFSPFDPSVSADDLFRSAFAALGRRPIVMAHPGYVDDGLRSLDEVVATRPEELAYLRSDRFSELLRQRRIRLVPRPSAD